MLLVLSIFNLEALRKEAYEAADQEVVVTVEDALVLELA